MLLEKKTFKYLQKNLSPAWKRVQRRCIGKEDLIKIPKYVIIWRGLAILLLTNRWNPENILREGVAFPAESTTCTKFDCCFGEILTKHIYIEKGFLCVVNLFNDARKTVSNSGKGSFSSIEQRFSRLYLLRISKGQLGPRDIDLINNNIGRRLTCQGFCNKIYIRLIYTT